MNQETIAELARAIARELAPHIVQIVREAAAPGALTERAETEIPAAQTVLRYGALEIDTARHEVTLRGRLIDLQPRVFALLVSLARNPGRVLSRELLLELAWPGDKLESVYDRTVDVHIRRLRRDLGNEGAHIIKTVHGIGYKLDDRARALR
jgi:two-component system response regulator VanR